MSRALLLLPFLFASCYSTPDHREPERQKHGAVVIFPGIFGDGPRYGGIVKGLMQGGIEQAVAMHRWTDPAILFSVNLRAEERNRRKAREGAARLVKFIAEHEGEPTFLVGHSGGGAFTLFVLEELPEDSKVTGAILLAPAISQTYDLTKALSRTERGIWHFHSEHDTSYLGAGTAIFGTADGEYGAAAGLKGFKPPEELSAEGRELYRTKLHQRGYDDEIKATGVRGSHWDWLKEEFVLRILVPIIQGGD
jgi:pimeloyl-ACP methyl ester carboxylesterase